MQSGLAGRVVRLAVHELPAAAAAASVAVAVVAFAFASGAAALLAALHARRTEALTCLPFEPQSLFVAASGGSVQVTVVDRAADLGMGRQGQEEGRGQVGIEVVVVPS